jgi:hypothetical protein
LNTDGRGKGGAVGVGSAQFCALMSLIKTGARSARGRSAAKFHLVFKRRLKPLPPPLDKVTQVEGLTHSRKKPRELTCPLTTETREEA